MLLTELLDLRRQHLIIILLLSNDLIQLLYPLNQRRPFLIQHSLLFQILTFLQDIIILILKDILLFRLPPQDLIFPLNSCQSILQILSLIVHLRIPLLFLRELKLQLPDLLLQLQLFLLVLFKLDVPFIPVHVRLLHVEHLLLEGLIFLGKVLELKLELLYLEERGVQAVLVGLDLVYQLA